MQRELAFPQLRSRGLLAMAVMLVALATALPKLAGAAQAGAGTELFRCRDGADIQMGICYLNARGYVDKVKCNYAHLLDQFDCSADATWDLIAR